MESGRSSVTLSVPAQVASLPTETFVLIIFAVVGFSILILDLVLVLLTLKTQKQRMVRNSFTSMDHCCMQGALMLVLAVILAGLHGDLVPSLVKGNIMCYASSVLVMTGITTCMGALLMKAVSVYYHFESKQRPIQNWLPCLGVLLLLLVDAGLCIARALVNPFEPQRTSLESAMTCSSDNNMYWTIGFLVYKGLIVLFSVLMSIAALRMSRYVPTDMKYVSVSSLLNALLYIGGIVLMFALSMTTTVTYIAYGAIILAACIQSLVSLILAKVKSQTLERKSRDTDIDLSTGHVYHNPSLAMDDERSDKAPHGGTDSYRSSGHYENAQL